MRVTATQLETGGFRRKWGNKNLAPVDPYITGHFINKWLFMPSLGTTVDNFSPNNGILDGDLRVYLEQTCLSCTLPTGTLNRAEFQGLGNQRWSAATNIDWDTTVTCRFLEFSGTPLLNLFHAWVRRMRDYRTGIASDEPGAAADNEGFEDYGKRNYAASMVYATFDPGGRFEAGAVLTGLFPLKDPRDLYGHDLTAIDKLEIDIDFNVDTIWQERTQIEEAFGREFVTGEGGVLNLQSGINQA